MMQFSRSLYLSKGKLLYATAAVALTSVLAVPVAHADGVNLVSNPNFSGGTPNDYPGVGPVPGWTFGAANAAGSNDSTGPFAAYGIFPAGIATAGFIQSRNHDDGSPTNSASTTLAASLVAGDTYDYSFYYDPRDFYNSNGEGTVSIFTASLGDQTLYSVTDTLFAQNYTLIQGSFVSDGSSNVLQFADAAPVDGSIDITGVSVTAVTPEPSSLVLLGTGAIGRVAVARRRFPKA